MRPSRVRVGHSPDPDDAFMFYGIASGRVGTAPYVVDQVLEDIEALNRRALAGELEVTAASIHACAHLADRYALMPCGSSMGDGYGPCVVSRSELDVEALASRTIAVPGTLTSAFLALRLLVGSGFRPLVVPFDRILDAVVGGEVDAGLIIHEGQLTYAEHGLHLVVDLGVWWSEHTGGLPLPLGGNLVRKDLGPSAMRRLTEIVRASIELGLDHRQEALEYALAFARGLDRDRANRFVGMYVNELTRDCGERGRRAIDRLLNEGRAAGLLPRPVALEFVS
jgi:1,4-dihydroxy-6-naphthoate synthase